MSKDCPCEATKQSNHSPTKVANDEALLYALIEPHNYEQNDISARAFSRTELTECQVSVSRKKYTTKEILQKEVIEVLLQKDPRRKFIGVLQAGCGEVRSLKTHDPKNKRVFCVIDDGTPNNSGHVHIGFSEITKAQPKNHKTAHRANLISLFGNERSIRDVYN
jgi:hypothetical protein